MPNFKKVKVTTSINLYLDIDNYPDGATIQDAVAFDVQNNPDEWLEMYIGLAEQDEIFVISVEEAPEEKNEVALLAERMSKEL